MCSAPRRLRGRSKKGKYDAVTEIVKEDDHSDIVEEAEQAMYGTAVKA